MKAWGRRRVPATPGAALVLMYHRVLPDKGDDPFGMAVSTAHFAAHMAALKTMTETVSLDALEARHASAFAGGGTCVCVTFDDGYVDNLRHARPILEQAGVPATIFLSTDYIGSDRPFWWDEVDRLLRRLPDRAPRLPELGGDWNLDDAKGFAAARDAVTGRLKRLTGAARERWLDDVHAACGLAREPADADGRPVRWDEVRAAAGEAIAFEPHGCSHASLGFLPADEAAREIRESKRVVDRELGRASRYFAYPNGKPEDVGAGHAAVFEAAGLACAFTTSSGAVRADTPRDRMPRVAVRDSDAAAFTARLRQFLPEAGAKD